MRERACSCLTAVAALAIALVPFAGARAQGPAGDPTETVRAFTGAFESREVDALIALAHPEIEWLTVSGSEVAVETRGRDALRESLTGYFASCPSCRSTTDIYQVVGPWVSALEHAEWEKEGRTLRQSALAVYEIVDGLVRRVWYYPAVRAAEEEADAPAEGDEGGEGAQSADGAEGAEAAEGGTSPR
jgi:hypothetical protein